MDRRICSRPGRMDRRGEDRGRERAVTDCPPQARLSSEYEWHVDRPEQARETDGWSVELYDVRKAKEIMVAAPRVVELIKLDEPHRVFFEELLEAVRLKS